MLLPKEIKDKKLNVIIEIGSGDGQFLINAATKSKEKNSLYIGIEIDKQSHEKALKTKEEKKLKIYFVNTSIENVIYNIEKETIHTIFFILPHPNYIDKSNFKSWSILYKEILDRLKDDGEFILVTEFIDELLEPIKDIDYINWKNWLTGTLTNIGFTISKIIDGSPSDYTSVYLEKFRRDPERIRIITLILKK